MQSSEIRRKFLAFFEKNGHTLVPSSSLLPDDPSVLLTTAGMQQFKDYYTGAADPMATIHPNLGRPLGSKNAASIQKSFRTSDIDEVGDERHLTFFEMLGNFSFGGYFKEEAIKLAHEFLTSKEWMGLEISYVTIFEGKEDIKDEDSRRIWLSRGIPPEKIVEQGMDDVFWGPTGSSGPCGPTTEIYCQNEEMKRAGIDPVEIWNIVFNEFFFPGSREELLSGNSGKKLERLKTPGVDTGMGLERLAMVAQGKKNIFETDLFNGVIKKMGGEGSRSQLIVADHIRAAVFLIGDGVVPGNKDRGYILRRLLRRVGPHFWEWRAVGLQRFAHGEPPPLVATPRSIAQLIIDQYGLTEQYNDLNNKKEEILAVIDEEYEKFQETYKKGARMLEYLISEAKNHNTDILAGKDIFDLVSSYGFALDWIKDIAVVNGLNLDLENFKIEFEKHRQISRAGSEAKFGGHGLYLKTGEVTIRDESEVEKVTRLHTATHLLHAGLRAVLGPEVRQDGSDITVERTRFDFRFPRKVAPDELKKVEDWVNEAVRRDLKVEWEEMSYEEAVQKGALGFFKEKYPPRVKVYSMIDEKTGEVFSREFCGGPHVARTAEVGRFSILKEESSSAGVRRIRGKVE